MPVLRQSTDSIHIGAQEMHLYVNGNATLKKHSYYLARQGEYKTYLMQDTFIFLFITKMDQILTERAEYTY
jgi:hypothetical protein